MRTTTWMGRFGFCSIIIWGIGISPLYSAETEETPPPTKTPDLSHIHEFTTAVGEIKSFYVDKVSEPQLFENAIRGMVSGLDPHSAYLDKEEYKELQINTTGEYGGLGIEMTMEDGMIKVIAPIDNSPAAKAGVLAGDIIYKLDQKFVKGLTLKEAMDYMRGTPGTKIALTIFRKSEKNNPLILTIERAIVQVNTVTSKLYHNNYGYIRISQFEAPTEAALKKAVENLKTQTKDQLYGLVLDLRNNPGGLLDSATEIADDFLDANRNGTEPLIVYTQGRAQGSDLVVHAKAGDMLKGVPIVVLINQGSASGSEIVAGALQDDHRAIIMGEKSFGKGSVQTILPLTNDTGIKLTTARYFTPSGRSIQAKGIEPDVVVHNMKVSEIMKPLEEGDGLSESNLKGHLEQINLPSDASKPAEVENTSEEKILDGDYQLLQAVTLLEGLYHAQLDKAQSS